MSLHYLAKHVAPFWLTVATDDPPMAWVLCYRYLVLALFGEVRMACLKLLETVSIAELVQNRQHTQNP